MSPELVAAYRAARYRVETSPAFELEIDRRSAPLAALHEARRVCCSAFLTACNPASVRLSDPNNASRKAALEAEIRGRGYPVLAARGLDPLGSWPDEPGLLILGIPLSEACAIASSLGQNAIVWNGDEAVPTLVPVDQRR